MNEQATQRHRSPTSHEIAVQALLHGVRSIANMPIKPSRRSMQRACSWLRGQRRGELADEIESRYELRLKRGAKIPTRGQDRVYRVQESAGYLFFRIPAAALGCGKGDRALLHVSERGRKLILVPLSREGIEELGLDLRKVEADTAAMGGGLVDRGTL
jgi:hypothetical protein